MRMRRLIFGVGVIHGTNNATKGAVVSQCAIKQRTIELKYCPTEYMVADIMTRAVGHVKLERLLKNNRISQNQMIPID